MLNREVGVRLTADLTRPVQPTTPSALGYGCSTYGATPLSDVTQREAERRLDARSVRIPVGWRNGRVSSSAQGGPPGLDVPALVKLYRSWGYGVLVVLGGRTTDADIQAGDAARIMAVLGHEGVEYSTPNEPSRGPGNSLARQVAVAEMIHREGVAGQPDFTVWGPAWDSYSLENLEGFARRLGPDRLAGVDYHRYGMGETSISTAQAMRETPRWGREVRELRRRLRDAGLPTEVNVDELNFSWRYLDGTPGGNDRFFTAVNSVWMASVCGHVLLAGGRVMPYANQNGALGLLVDRAGPNPDGRLPSSPLPAYWGVAAWTGAGAWPHYHDTFYATSSSDPSTEMFAVGNEAGGYNLVLLNKDEQYDRKMHVNILGGGRGSYSVYVSDRSAPYDELRRLTGGRYTNSLEVELPAMTMGVVVLRPLDS